MQTSSTGITGRPASPPNGIGVRVLAVILLSLGIGAATAAFTVIDALMPHAAAYPSCDTVLSLGGERMVLIGMDGGPMLRDRVAGAYVSGVDAASDGLDEWSDEAMEAADVAPVVVLSAAALALLVVCANAARALAARSERTLPGSGIARVALAAGGALAMSTLVLRAASTSPIADVLGSIPSARPDVRAIAFALCISALVEARRRVLPRLT